MYQDGNRFMTCQDRPRISKSIGDQRNRSISKTFRSDKVHVKSLKYLVINVILLPLGKCSQTYNSDAQIGDSAACATALLCGVKTNFGTVGVDSTARFNQCESLGAGAAAVPSLVTWAQEEGGLK
uniref:alkaline phosphatase n=1 Tax=Timema californicum TaxID=61474 RepID=A0A7R9JA16_TIMCA|nr:unnamed protein product [Timema californicum]